VKRRAPTVIRICLFLLLGAIANVAVAWGCAQAMPDTTVGIHWDLGNGVQIVETVAIGRGTTYVTTLRAYEPMKSMFEDSGLPSIERLPSWVTLTTPAEAGHWLHDVAAGLPFRSLAMRWHRQWADRSGWRCTQVDCALSLRDLPVGMPPGPTCVPLRPIWSGFAMNTLFYAAILWLLFAAPFALRRRRRIKRGLCPACAYPVGDSTVCTECGKPVKPKEMAA
jgi:hypothetical protein